MDQIRLNGPYSLLCDALNDELVEDCPGVFALGYTDYSGRFCVTFVGSAGRDMKSKLRRYIGTAAQFKFRHFPDERQAFEKECELFHRFMPFKNFLHPERPEGTTWQCPGCSQ